MEREGGWAAARGRTDDGDAAEHDEVLGQHEQPPELRAHILERGRIATKFSKHIGRVSQPDVSSSSQYSLVRIVRRSVLCDTATSRV